MIDSDEWLHARVATDAEESADLLRIPIQRFRVINGPVNERRALF